MECLECQEQITNPICNDCLATAINQWFPGLSLPGTEFHYGESCIICSNKINICAYCYTEDIHNWLLAEKPEIAEEFKEIFHL